MLYSSLFFDVALWRPPSATPHFFMSCCSNPPLQPSSLTSHFLISCCSNPPSVTSHLLTSPVALSPLQHLICWHCNAPPSALSQFLTWQSLHMCSGDSLHDDFQQSKLTFVCDVGYWPLSGFTGSSQYKVSIWCIEILFTRLDEPQAWCLLSFHSLHDDFQQSKLTFSVM